VHSPEGLRPDTSKAGINCPIALPMGLHMAPIVVAVSRSFTANHMDDKAGGEFKYIGWVIAARACPIIIRM